MPFRPVVLAVSLLAVPATALAQAAPSSTARVGLGVAVSTLGVEIEAATRVTAKTNVRMAFNVFSYSHDFNNDGSTYAASLKLRSLEVYFDWFPSGGGFHVSPGVMLYNGNQANLNITTPAGQTFTLNNTTYYSNPANPVSGTGQVTFNKVGPALRLGWGNLLPRGSRHWSIPVEFGVIYQQAPALSFALSGSVCNVNGTNCRTIASDPTVQSNVTNEQNKVNNDLNPFKFYPVASIGFGYSF